MATTMTAAEREEAEGHSQGEGSSPPSPCECPSCQKRRAVFHEQRARAAGNAGAFAAASAEGFQNGLTARQYMATQFMAALVRRGVMGGSFDSIENCRKKVAAEAVALADALLMELVK